MAKKKCWNEGFLSTGISSLVNETIVKFYHNRAVPSGKDKYDFTCLHGHVTLGLTAEEVMAHDRTCKQCDNNEVNTKEFYIDAITKVQGIRRFDLRPMGDVTECSQKVDVVCPRHGLVALPITSLLDPGTVSKPEPCEFCAMSNLHVAVAVVYSKSEGEYSISLTDSYPALQSFVLGNGKQIMMIKAGAESVVTQNYRSIVSLLRQENVPLKGKGDFKEIVDKVTVMYKDVAHEHNRQADLAFGELEHVMALTYVDTLPEIKSNK